MIVGSFPSGPLETNAYVIGCPETHEAVIVDPGLDSAKQIEAFLAKNGLKATQIWLTHSHWDHIGDVAYFKEKYGLPIYIHANDAPNLIKPGADGLPCWVPIAPAQPDVLIDEGDVLSVGKQNFTVLFTPGHSGGSVCLYAKEGKLLLSGDTFFQGTIGKISFPTSRPDLMWDSLKKLAKLPASTKVLPGHGEATTIGAERWLDDAETYFGV